ncbi:carbon-nitrogen hydrolase family protein [Peribacillus cavernae]|uniref:Carbon-nitrogen hydrolase family protein n=1 Tax=Peribacillus cavernae TaxID=1674310 RepID=A0A3S0U9Y4_9BACI|nr:carbon-nitrogen hydrolase family protein [Peribacillus cavernae]MDQ0221395.1 N-carbamoylputrescine amidase [Peribacillus cavernae]RUQ25789.1 carbon-nitrogen hydrolase family protein [Peribacillus cavernae]
MIGEKAISSVKLKVAGIQLGPYLGSYNTQMDNIVKLSEKLLSSQEVDILCLPELMTSPYFCSVELDDFQKYAESIPGPTTQTITALAKKYDTTIIGTLFEKDSKLNKYYNTAFISSPDGKLIGKYRKTHIPFIDVPGTRALEKKYFSPGEELKPFIINRQSVGILICYDRSFPEAWRELVLNNAKVVFVPTSGSGFRSEAFVEELRIRALENGVFVVAVNKYGTEKMEEEKKGKKFYGKSCVIDPLGNVIESLEDLSDQSFQVELSLDMIDDARLRLSYFRDRRPDLYTSLIEPV